MTLQHARLGAFEARFVDAPIEPHTRVVLFGAGDYRMRTEDRPPPPRVQPGDALCLGVVSERVSQVSSVSPRLITLAWQAPPARVWEAIYAHGQPVQYSYIPQRLPLWSVQTLFAARPWAAEMPSAARPLSWSLLLALRARGVDVVPVTHAAGLSATGDASLDAALPLPERYELPLATVERIARAKREGGRVIAVGTTVVRALEACAQSHGALRAGIGIAETVIGPRTQLRVVDGLLTGIYVVGESHYQLLQAFVKPQVLAQATRHAIRMGYRQHENGDACLLLPRAHTRVAGAAA